WVAAVIVDDRKPREPGRIGVGQEEGAACRQDERLLEEPGGAYVPSRGGLEGQREVDASCEQLVQPLALRSEDEPGGGEGVLRREAPEQCGQAKPREAGEQSQPDLAAQLLPGIEDLVERGLEATADLTEGPLQRQPLLGQEQLLAD